MDGNTNEGVRIGRGCYGAKGNWERRWRGNRGDGEGRTCREVMIGKDEI